MKSLMILAYFACPRESAVIFSCDLTKDVEKQHRCYIKKLTRMLFESKFDVKLIYLWNLRPKQHRRNIIFEEKYFIYQFFFIELFFREISTVFLTKSL